MRRRVRCWLTSRDTQRPFLGFVFLRFFSLANYCHDTGFICIRLIRERSFVHRKACSWRKNDAKTRGIVFRRGVKIFRERTSHKIDGRQLSQDKLADQITKKSGQTITRNRVAKWERGKASISADDRQVLLALVAILTRYEGINSLEDANRLLKSGGYHELDPDEIGEVNPRWVPSTPGQKGKLGPNHRSLIPSLERMGKGEGEVPQINMNIGAEHPLPFEVTLHHVNSGPGTAPPLPALIIGRDDDLRKLKKHLGISRVNKPAAAIQIVTAIKGWPGVGKTTLASALAYDPEIQNAYPDGVLWVSLGQEPNLLSEIAAWGRALGTEELLRARNLTEAQSQLRALLREKRVLLIIDDVWQVEHAKPFNVGGRNCGTLITTRLEGVATALAPTAADVYRLKVLKDEDALILLKKLAPSVVKGHPQECMVLAQELEGLPLALQVAGRLLNTEANLGFGVVELIKELRTGARLLVAQPPADRFELANETTPTIAALLQRSLAHLDEATLDRYAYLGAFAPKPATFDLDAMKFVWQVEDPEPTVRALVDRGLLESIPEQHRYQMHALLVMLAKSLLKED